MTDPCHCWETELVRSGGLQTVVGRARGSQEREFGVAETLTWEGQRNLTSLQGKSIRVRFLIRDVKLFAFQFPQH